MDGQKRCPRCEQWKAVEEFPPSKQTNDGLFPYCRECKRERRREEYHKDPSHERAKQAEYYQAHRDELIARSAEQYKEKRAEQIRQGLDHHSKKYTPDGKRICTGCKQPRKLSEFANDPRYSDGLRSRCRECQNKTSKAYYHSNRESQLVYKQRYNKDNPEKARHIKRKARLKKEYNLTPDEYAQMLVAQQNRCIACKQEFREDVQALNPHIDHCHTSGTVRGILCNNCNVALGLLKDDPQRMWELIKYLANFKPKT